MRDQFVGDVGDFGKYGLLRRLIGLTDCKVPEPDLTLGVVWYYRPDEPKDPSGRLTQYSESDYHDRDKYESCDPELWQILGELVRNDKRYVRYVEKSLILPAGTKYFRDTLDYAGIKPGDPRKRFRADWLQRALRATEGADIVFLDPDNNIPPHENQRYRKGGPKYAYVDEINAFWDRGQSVVVYHHTNMAKSVCEQIRETADRLQEELGAKPISLRWRSFETRAFFVVPQPEHRQRIEERIKRMMAGPWGEHFKQI